MNGDGTYTIVAKPVFPLRDTVDFEGVFSTTGNQNFKIVARDFLTTGLKANLSLDHHRRQVQAGDGKQVLTSQKVSAAFDYIHKNATVSAKLSLPTLVVDVPAVALGAVYTKEQYAFGFEASLNPKDAILCDRVTVNAETKVKDSVITLSASSSAARDVSAVARYFIAQPKFDFSSEVAWIGATQKVEGAVAFARILSGGGLAKIAFRTCGSIGLSFKRTISNASTLTVGTEVNVTTLVHHTGINFEFDC